MFIHGGRLARCSIHGSEPISVFFQDVWVWVVGRTLEWFQNASVILREHLQICEFKKKRKRKHSKHEMYFWTFWLAWRLTFTSHWLESLRTALRNPAARQKERIKRWSNPHSQISGTIRKCHWLLVFTWLPWLFGSISGCCPCHLIFLFSVFSCNTFVWKCSLFGEEEFFFLKSLF